MLFNASHVWIYLEALAREPRPLLAFVPLVVYVVTTSPGLPYWNAIGIDDNQVAWLHWVSFLTWPFFMMAFEGPTGGVNPLEPPIDLYDWTRNRDERRKAA